LAEALFLGVALSAAQDVRAQAKPDKDKVRIGYAARAVAHCVPYVAKEAGFFAEEGIDAEIVRTAGSIAPIALVANEVDFAIISAYLLDHLAEAQPRFAQHRPAEFIDARILTELDKGGYIDKLYGGQAK
jgi:ABC-type nitrate/sulfonate/bicarbonate transport system substrate-binding protein